MGAGASAAASGVVFGLAVCLLGQQFGLIDLGQLYSGVLSLFVYALVFGIIFGVVGVAIGRRYLKRHQADTGPKTTEPSQPPAADAEGAPVVEKPSDEPPS